MNTVCDTSVLINFLKIDRLDLLQKHHHSFWITDHVHEEISDQYPDHRSLCEKALQAGILTKTTVENSNEFELFADLCRSRQLGAGECAAIAVAASREYHLAIDDLQAIKKARTLSIPPTIFRTQDLIVHLIHDKILSLVEADQLLLSWATHHRFKLKIESFLELLTDSNFLLGEESAVFSPYSMSEDGLIFAF